MNAQNIDSVYLAGADDRLVRQEFIINNETMENQIYYETCDINKIHGINSLGDGTVNNLNTGFENTENR